MAKVTPRWINFDVQSLTGTSTLTVYLKSSGGLERTVDGIQIVSSGVTDDMLAGSIGLDKLIKAVITADGTVSFTGDQNMGGNKLTNLAQASNPTDAVTFNQLQSWVAGTDFQADVLNTQVGATLDPGSPNNGDRYIITDSGNMHANFGTISGIENNDIVQYNSDTSVFEVVYDVSVQGEGVLTWDRANDHFKQWDGTIWTEHGGLTGVTAGDGLSKIGNELSIVVSDFAGTGLEDSGGNDLRLSTQGNGIAGGNGALLSIQSDNVSGGDIAPVSVTGDGVGVNVNNLNGDHLDITYTPNNYTPDSSPAEAVDVDDLAAHLKGIDSAILAAGSGSKTVVYKEITSTIISNGFFTLSTTPEDPSLVSITPVGGPQQVNKKSVAMTGVTPDYDVLNTNEVHINNTGSATGLSDCFIDGDVLMIEYGAAYAG